MYGQSGVLSKRLQSAFCGVRNIAKSCFGYELTSSIYKDDYLPLCMHQQMDDVNALGDAAYYGDLAKVKKLLAKGVHIDSHDKVMRVCQNCSR